MGYLTANSRPAAHSENLCCFALGQPSITAQHSGCHASPRRMPSPLSELCHFDLEDFGQDVHDLLGRQHPNHFSKRNILWATVLSSQRIIALLDFPPEQLTANAKWRFLERPPKLVIVPGQAGFDILTVACWKFCRPTPHLRQEWAGVNKSEGLSQADVARITAPLVLT